MRILFFGDIVGRAGRDAFIKYLPSMKDEFKPDFIIANGENAAHGFGITSLIGEELFALGVDVITLGNHTWDQRESVDYIDKESRILRPLNYPKSAPGFGRGIYQLTNGKKIVVINAMGQLFMETHDHPFEVIEEELKRYALTGNVDAIFIDFHAEATSEKVAIAHYFDGKVSAVIGTHSHVPTADARILPKGTAFQTDAGMCGDYDSVIGMKKEIAIARFMRKIPKPRLEPADGVATVCGVFVETSDKTGLASLIQPFKRGGILSPI